MEAQDNGGREGYGRRKGKEREVGVLNGRDWGGRDKGKLRNNAEYFAG